MAASKFGRVQAVSQFELHELLISAEAGIAVSIAIFKAYALILSGLYDPEMNGPFLRFCARPG